MAIEDCDALIAVMGATGVGKSTFVNLVSGSELAVGEGLRSCTAEVQVSRRFTLDGRSIVLLDTPGFDDTLLSDTEILKRIAAFLASSYRSNKTLTAILYLHRISDTRMGGTSRRNFSMFRALCGDKSLASVVLVTTMWNTVARDKAEARERELRTDEKMFAPVLAKGARMMRNEGSLENARQILSSVLGNANVVLEIQTEIVVQGKSVEMTRAQAELEAEEVRKTREKQEEEARLQREAAAAALRAQEEQKVREVEEAKRAQEEAERKAREEQERQQREREAARAHEEERLRQVERKLAEEAEARKREEERLQRIREDKARQEREAEEQRRRQQAEIDRLRRRNDDCRIF